MYSLIIIEEDGVDVLEYLLQVGLDSRRFLCLGEYLQEVIIREEVEPSELLPLLLKVVVQLFLNDFKVLIGLLETLK
jgi:hypothetical protein